MFARAQLDRRAVSQSQLAGLFLSVEMPRITRDVFGSNNPPGFVALFVDRKAGISLNLLANKGRHKWDFSSLYTFAVLRHNPAHNCGQDCRSAEDRTAEKG